MSIPDSINEKISIFCGADMALALSVVNDESGSPIDLSTRTAFLKVRNENYEGALALELTEADGLSLGTDGIITVGPTAAQTLAVRDIMPKSGVYTLEVTLGSIVNRTHYGTATLLDTTIHS